MKNKLQLTKYNTIGIQERKAVNEVMKTGVLSDFFANKNGLFVNFY